MVLRKCFRFVWVTVLNAEEMIENKKVLKSICGSPFTIVVFAVYQG